MKRFLALALALTLMLTLAACGGQEPEETTAAPVTTQTPTTAPTTEPETEPPTTVVETESPVLYRNPLNGEPVEAPYTARPVAVTINNIKQAMPQCGVESADIIYEVLAEGGITRCLAIFDDISGIEHLGAIRSARTYFVDLALGLDALYVHHGYSTYALDLLQAYNVNDLCPIRGRGSSAYYRDKDRLNSGYSLEHTSFADGDDLLAQMEKRGYAMEREAGIDYGWTFVDDATPAGGEQAETITVNFRSGGKKTILSYDGETGLYEAAQYGKDYIDGNTGETMAFRNILVIKAKSWTDSEGYRQFVEMTDTSGEGFYACGGKIIPIRWSRGGYREPFVYTLEDGTPLELSVGSSYVAIIPLKSPVDYK